MSIVSLEEGFKKMDKKTLEDFQIRILENPQDAEEIKLEAIKELFRQNGISDVKVKYSEDKGMIYLNYKPSLDSEKLMSDYDFFPGMRLYSRHWSNPEHRNTRISLTIERTDVTSAIDDLISKVSSPSIDVIEKEREKERKVQEDAFNEERELQIRERELEEEEERLRKIQENKQQEYELYYGMSKEEQYSLNLLDTEIYNELDDLSYRQIASFKVSFNDGLKEIRLIYKGEPYFLKAEEGFISNLQAEPVFNKLFELLDRRNKIEGLSDILQKNMKRLQEEEYHLYYGLTEEQEKLEQEHLRRQVEEPPRRRLQEVMRRQVEEPSQRRLQETREGKRALVQGMDLTSQSKMEDAYEEAQNQRTMEEAYNKAFQMSFESVYEQIQKAQREHKDENAEGLIELGLLKAMEEEDFKQFDKFLSMTECLDKDLMENLLSRARQKEDRRFVEILSSPSVVHDFTTRIASGRAFETMTSHSRICGL